MVDAQPKDAAAIDAIVEDTSLNCGKAESVATVSLYDFNADPEGVIVDGAGTNSGTLAGTPTYVAGPSTECGMALALPGTLTDFAVAPDIAAWQLDVGSVDFWFRIDAEPADYSVVVARDASGTALPGHFTVAVDSGGGLAVRVQQESAPNNAVGTVCSAAGAVTIGEWNHVGVNFGQPGLELWHNSVEVDAPGSVAIFDCQTGTTLGLAGSQNPFVLGVGSTFSNAGEATPVDHPFEGAIDHFRVSNARKDYSGIAYKPVAP